MDLDTGPQDTGPPTLLQTVAAIVIPNCAIGGCHDSTSVTHGMDLTTADKIFDNWVNKGGFDHCTGREVPRVIPGDPDGSLVVIKITGVAVCTQSERMPLPPRPALTPEQIAVIRTWIAAYAPSDRPQPDGGGPPDDAGSEDGDDGSGLPMCSAARSCDPGQTCSGNSCGGPWECLAHFDDTLEHPCEPTTIPFCGCDGVTFEASFTCPDRPWRHAGACGDGVSCFDGAVTCSDPKPVCKEGQEASVVGDCYGPCVDIRECRCLYHYQCPNGDRNTCLYPDYRCGPKPNIQDGGSDGSQEDGG